MHHQMEEKLKPEELVEALLEGFISVAHPDKAAGMAAYMKHHFVFIGVPKPERAIIQKSWLPLVKSYSSDDLHHLAQLLWERPEREMHYAAMDFLKAAKKQWNAASIQVFEQINGTHSWWDSVDLIASGLIGPWFLQTQTDPRPYAERWRDSNQLWFQRVSIIFQLTYRDKTDWQLMQDMIVPLIPHPDFFIRKAIGWALRQYARTAPQRVIDFVNQHPQLSNLSKKEALKHLGG
jgi:3-methyladenine DNA glycosylase AlkD